MSRVPVCFAESEGATAAQKRATGLLECLAPERSTSPSFGYSVSASADEVTGKGELVRIDGERFRVKTDSDGTNAVVGELNSQDEYGYGAENRVRHDDVVLVFTPNGFGKEDNVIVLSSQTASSLTWALLRFYTRKTALYLVALLAIGIVTSMCGRG